MCDGFLVGAEGWFELHAGAMRKQSCMLNISVVIDDGGGAA